jgi:Uma2 family endonuclease
MALNLKQEADWISEEAYLQGELLSEIKHEYIDGAIYAMAGASKNHQRIIANVSGEFWTQLKNMPCESFSSDIKVKVGSKFFYPDVMVVCKDDSDNAYYTESPVIIVEVLSKSTRRMDETAKKFAYQTLTSLKEYVLIEQDFVDVEICRRSEGWISRHYFMGDTVTFESLGITISVADIYERVENDDVSSFIDSLALS